MLKYYSSDIVSQITRMKMLSSLFFESFSYILQMLSGVVTVFGEKLSHRRCLTWEKSFNCKMKCTHPIMCAMTVGLKTVGVLVKGTESKIYIC